MTKGEDYRRRILYILQILWEKSDEEHPITAVQLITMLAAKGITCERKSIYADLEALLEFGFDVMKTKQGAYIGKRYFETPELKLLVDAVQASKFITEKKSSDLINKLGGLANETERRQLKRQVHVKKRGKSVNESIYYNVDAINEGIQQNCKITFTYWNWNAKKEMVPKHGGSLYKISPWLLIWENEKYYMVGYDDVSQQMKHFRVDKMLKIKVTDEDRQGKYGFEEVDIATYGMESFGMFQGRRETVTLRADKELAGALIDRFGTDVWIHPINERKCSVVTEVVVSNPFFGWITGLGGKVRIEGPRWVKEEFEKLLCQFMELTE